MTTNPPDLISRILAIPAESRSIEFKRIGRGEGSVSGVIESIVAMANTDGGTIILGIDDPEKTTKKGMERIYGIEENPEGFDEVGRSLRDVSPPIAGLWPPKLLPIPNSGKRVALVFVEKGTEDLHSFRNRAYVRLEKGNKQLSPHEIIHFSYVKGFRRADRELVQNIDLKLLKTTVFESWRRARGLADDDISVVLEKTGLARTEDGLTSPTCAAVMLFADHPSDLMETKCTIRVFQYEGKQERISDVPNLIGTPKTIDGPIIRQIQEAHSFVLGLLRSGIRIPSGFVTTYKIPERAVKEAITNAVIHRDYFTKRDIEVKIFEDRIEVESPGLLPFNITLGNIGRARAQGYRNDLLVKHLREFPEPPNLDQNEGVRAMRQTMSEARLYPPSFVTYPEVPDSVRVVLFNQEVPSEWDKIFDYLQKEQYVNNQDARRILGIGDTVKMSKLLKRWVRQGVLVSVVPASGAKKNIRYRLPSGPEGSLFTTPPGKQTKSDWK